MSRPQATRFAARNRGLWRRWFRVPDRDQQLQQDRRKMRPGWSSGLVRSVNQVRRDTVTVWALNNAKALHLAYCLGSDSFINFPEYTIKCTIFLRKSNGSYGAFQTFPPPADRLYIIPRLFVRSFCIQRVETFPDAIGKDKRRLIKR
jgi:hypothetical protein